MIFKEYDVIRLKRFSNEVPLQPGTEGTILMIHDHANYEVEFFDRTGKSVGTFTVKRENIELVLNMTD
jgi:Domain of unknown function (DUF4926)